MYLENLEYAAESAARAEAEGYRQGYRDALEELIQYHRGLMISAHRRYGKLMREGYSGIYTKQDYEKQKYALWSARWNLENCNM